MKFILINKYLGVDSYDRFKRPDNGDTTVLLLVDLAVTT
jgi:hypothetical protein